MMSNKESDDDISEETSIPKSLPDSRTVTPTPTRRTAREAFAKWVLTTDQSYTEAMTEAELGIKNVEPVKVGIIGAGMAGLYAGMILKSLNIDFEILEADSRSGGRVYTYHFPESNQHRYGYIDMGAMRYPCLDIMDRVIGEQKWSLVKKIPGIKLIKYIMNDKENNPMYYNGIRRYANQDRKVEDPFGFGDTKNGGEGKGVPDKFAKRPYDDWIRNVYERFFLVESKTPKFEIVFPKLLLYDHLSVRSFLRGFDPEQIPHQHSVPDGGEQQQQDHLLEGHRGYPESVISWCETMDTGTGNYDQALTENVIDWYDFDAADWVCIDGGSTKLTEGMLNYLKTSEETNQPKTNKKVTRISPCSDKIKLTVKGEDDPTKYQYDHVICTVPLSVLRMMDLHACELSYKKRLAIRSLHYDSSVKVAMLFSSRWWQDNEFMNGKTCKGGKAVTDLPVVQVVYPSYALDNDKAPGVIIASYTWGQDAARMGAHSKTAEIEDLCLSNLAAIHGVEKEKLKQNLLETCVVDWGQKEFAQGAFALYGPGQFKHLFPSIISPEVNGTLHFAGEAASVHHAWVVGSLNSAYRCVREILLKERMTEKLDEMKQIWGPLESVELGEYKCQDENVEAQL